MTIEPLHSECIRLRNENAILRIENAALRKDAETGRCMCACWITGTVASIVVRLGSTVTSLGVI
jgi:hypothetical protein